MLTVVGGLKNGLYFMLEITVLMDLTIVSFTVLHISCIEYCLSACKYRSTRISIYCGRETRMA